MIQARNAKDAKLIGNYGALGKSLGNIGAKTAQYGIEATLPKAVGCVGDPIMQEANRRSKNIERVAEYEKKHLEVQNLLDRVAGDREVQVLNWMLDGMSQR